METIQEKSYVAMPNEAAEYVNDRINTNVALPPVGFIDAFTKKRVFLLDGE